MTATCPTHCPSVRLATAGWLSLLVLAWVAFAPDAMPVSDPRRGSIEAFVSAGLAMMPLIVLVPVLWHGPSRDRWLALMLSVFPTVLVVLEVVCMLR